MCGKEDFKVVRRVIFQQSLQAIDHQLLAICKDDFLGLHGLVQFALDPNQSKLLQ